MRKEYMSVAGVPIKSRNGSPSRGEGMVIGQMAKPPKKRKY